MEYAGDGRWIDQQSDGSASYVLRAGGRVRELHVSAESATLHVYEDVPLAAARHISSTERGDLAGADASTAWAALQ